MFYCHLCSLFCIALVCLHTRVHYPHSTLHPTSQAPSLSFHFPFLHASLHILHSLYLCICSTCCVLHTNISFSMFILYTLFCIASYQYTHHLFSIYHSPFTILFTIMLNSLYLVFLISSSIPTKHHAVLLTPLTLFHFLHPMHTMHIFTPSVHYAISSPMCTLPFFTHVDLAILHTNVCLAILHTHLRLAILHINVCLAVLHT